MPRAPGEKPPPALKQIPEGEPGEGQYLLPLGSNATSVDPDLINDIQSLPYAQRFRLIFNELGAGLAGRGEDLEAAIKRANPTLRSVDKLFGELTEQKDQLASLAAESQEILEPLTREKEHVVGFLAHSGEAAEASSEHGPELEAALQKFPRFLVEFRQTMGNLKEFSDAGTPLLKELGVAAPSLTDATRELTPFSEATTVALKSLGTAGEESGPVFAQADAGGDEGGQAGADRASSRPPNWRSSSSASKKTNGWQRLTELIYNSAAAFNGFDKYGHYGRALVTLTNCLKYVPKRRKGTSGCSANFNGRKRGRIAQERPRLDRRAADSCWKNAGRRRAAGPAPGRRTPGAPTTGLAPAHRPNLRGAGAREAEGEVEPALGEATETEAGTEPLLNYLLGPNEESERRIRGEPGAGRRGDRAGDHRRRLPRLQRQQRPALRLHLQPEGAGRRTPTRW